MFLAVLGAMLAVGPARAAEAVVSPLGRIDRTEAAPTRLRNVDVREHLGEQLPLDTVFSDADGATVKLGELLDGKLPTILTLNYSNCPMLCSLQLSGMTKALRELELTAGTDYRLITVSIDPQEDGARARGMRDKYLHLYGRGTPASWRFLRGDQRSIDRIADAIGFRYAYNEKRREYAHPAALVVLTPGGKIGRYLYGIEYDVRTLRLSLVESSAGKIGSTLDHFLLYCFHYDETEGRYAPMARNIMSLSGLVAVVALGSVLISLWIAELRKSKVRGKTPHPGAASV